MIKLLLRTFILFSFAISSVAGVSIHHHEETKTSHEAQVHEHEGSTLEYHGEEDCSSEESCCVGSCGCPASCLLKISFYNISISHIYDKELNWFYQKYYTSPVIEPALRPPLHS